VAKGENADVEDPEIENEVDTREEKILIPDNSQKLQITAKVVGIIKRNWRTYLPF
jgi:hypothetical protein